MSGSVSLEDARARIDAIDAEMHDLLMQRTEIVRDVAAAKASAGATGLSIRPGREAEVVRRLLNRHKGALPKAVIFRLWREIITAKAQIQTPFSLVLNESALRDVCRAHYGSNTELKTASSESEVLDAVRAGPTDTVGVVAVADDADQPWWLTLANWRAADARDEAVPTVVARLPFCAMEDGSQAQDVEAFSLAAVAAEKSGDDRTVIVVQGDLVVPKDLEVILLASSKGSQAAQLISVAGFYQNADDIPGIDNATVIGTYAVPYVLD